MSYEVSRTDIIIIFYFYKSENKLSGLVTYLLKIMTLISRSLL